MTVPGWHLRWQRVHRERTDLIPAVQRGLPLMTVGHIVAAGTGWILILHHTS